ncbi:MAG TPA: hypothetical protein VGC76_05335 [Pyrinomonadaceae bacterium]|jgi:hypothetical protein
MIKECPLCKRTYADNTLAFCLEDGSLLSAPFDPDATHKLSNHETNLPPTEFINLATADSVAEIQTPAETKAEIPTVVRPAVQMPDVPAQKAEAIMPAAPKSKRLPLVAVGGAMLLAVIALFAIFLVSRSSEKRDTPAKAIRTYIEAIRNKNLQDLKDSLSENTSRLLEAEAKGKNKTLDEILKTELETASAATKPGEVETQNEKITGDNATIEFRCCGNVEWSQRTFVKEKGEWKISASN